MYTAVLKQYAPNTRMHANFCSRNTDPIAYNIRYWMIVNLYTSAYMFNDYVDYWL